jgi:ubiquinone/menaquinone biosynthesis C-methylase UbiE
MSHATSLSNHNTHADFVYSAAYTAPVLSLLDAKPGEKIIDLGCGTGELTEQISKIVGPEGTVVGLDSSESMVSQFKTVIHNIAQPISVLYSAYDLTLISFT